MRIKSTLSLAKFTSESKLLRQTRRDFAYIAVCKELKIAWTHPATQQLTLKASTDKDSIYS
jgi:hypothetical protein